MEYFFTVLITVIAVAIVVILAKHIATHRFRCKHCLKEFSIGWIKVIFAEHSEDEYMLVCPHCKTKGWCDELLKK